MKHSILVFLLATATAVLATGCGQEQSGRQLGRPRGDQGPEANLDSPLAQVVEPGDGSPDEPDSRVAELRPIGESPGGDDEPLLLLGDGGEEMTEPTGPVADNSRCHHCHLNYVDEDIAVVHAHANIGCADCHGNCDEHIADESWADGGNGTPPEIMYTREKVNPCCLECHPKDELGKPDHDSFLAGTAKEKHCTDCHGEHRLTTERKCIWK